MVNALRARHPGLGGGHVATGLLALLAGLVAGVVAGALLCGALLAWYVAA